MKSKHQKITSLVYPTKQNPMRQAEPRWQFYECTTEGQWWPSAKFREPKSFQSTFEKEGVLGVWFLWKFLLSPSGSLRFEMDGCSGIGWYGVWVAASQSLTKMMIQNDFQRYQAKLQTQFDSCQVPAYPQHHTMLLDLIKVSLFKAALKYMCVACISLGIRPTSDIQSWLEPNSLTKKIHVCCSQVAVSKTIFACDCFSCYSCPFLVVKQTTYIYTIHTVLNNVNTCVFVSLDTLLC